MLTSHLLSHLTLPLRAALVMLCASAMLVFGTVVEADVAMLESAAPAVAISPGSHIGYATTAGATSMAAHASGDLCGQPCDPELPCSPDCIASCGSGGSSTVSAATTRLPYSLASSRTRTPQARDATLSPGPTLPPLLRPPIV